MKASINLFVTYVLPDTWRAFSVCFYLDFSESGTMFVTDYSRALFKVMLHKTLNSTVALAVINGPGKQNLNFT